ncbi:glycosyltransferase family 4 protein [Flammeovirgaceae bacterium SG7u.111]|nr:glycosyltransferase family 4 protein [Flammeovirgaceae bacterium SG7u.132]WPO34955.1 glycosyltransferase family 4 protein [Flammeovirgaceae bacterium SG7u.111]
MRILILAPYPKGEAPSQRFRFEQYLYLFDEKGIAYDYEPFISEQTWGILHKPGYFVQKALGIVFAFLRRLALLPQLGKYDFVFIHREASHIGPPIFEWLIAKVFRKKIIYDFDDAIWLPNYSEHNARFHWLKFYQKVYSIMKWSYKVSAGNDYLVSKASEYNRSVVCNPTTIDTEHYHNKVNPQAAEKPIIGWTGTLTTAKYLQELVPILGGLEQDFEFEFQMISNEAPKFDLESFKFIPWKKESEIEDLLQFNVGVMPLTDDIWANGKCGFKALQYMALGIPAIVSPVGVNTKIVDDGVNGFICEHPEEWYEKLSKLLASPELRKQMGAEARKKIEDHYSVKSNTSNFLSLFDLS